MPHPRYPWILLDACGTCGGRAFRVVDTPQGRVARCERCLRPRADERPVERITLAPAAALHPATVGEHGCEVRLHEAGG